MYLNLKTSEECVKYFDGSYSMKQYIDLDMGKQICFIRIGNCSCRNILSKELYLGNECVLLCFFFFFFFECMAMGGYSYMLDVYGVVKLWDVSLQIWQSE